MRGRAIRRKQLQLAKARARRRLPLWDLPTTAHWIGIHAHTPKLCSCWMCGNPRRFLGERTRQELLADMKTSLD
jgi:hypothetical protein